MIVPRVNFLFFIVIQDNNFCFHECIQRLKVDLHLYLILSAHFYRKTCSFCDISGGKPPPDRTIVIDHLRVVSQTLYFAMCALAFIGIIAGLACLVFNYRNQQRRSVVYVCVCMRVRMHAHNYAFMWVCVCVCVCARTSAHICFTCVLCLCTCVSVCTWLFTCFFYVSPACVNVSILIYMYICTCKHAFWVFAHGSLCVCVSFIVLNVWYVWVWVCVCVEGSMCIQVCEFFPPTFSDLNMLWCLLCLSCIHWKNKKKMRCLMTVCGCVYAKFYDLQH